MNVSLIGFVLIVSLIIYYLYCVYNQKPIIPVDDKIIIGTSKKHIFKDEHCQDGISENGVCKRQSGSDCLISSECSSNHACVNYNCTLKPQTWEECFETMCNEHTICVNQHIFKLGKNKFVMLEGWWVTKNSLDLVDSPIPNMFYLLNYNGLHLISQPIINEQLCDKTVRNEETNYNQLIKLADFNIEDDVTPIHLFTFRNALHVLCNNGKIYRGITNREVIRIYDIFKDKVTKLSKRSNNRYFADRKSNIGWPYVWEWEVINFVYGRDISNLQILDVTTSSDDAICITTTDSQLLYNHNKWNDETYFLVPQNKNRTLIKISPIRYGVNKNCYIQVEPYSISYFEKIDGDEDFNYHKVFTVNAKLNAFIDAVINPNEPYSIITLNEHGSCHKYNYDTVTSIIDTNILDEGRGITEEKRVVNDTVLYGVGFSLRATKNDVWLISNNTCMTT